MSSSRLELAAPFNQSTTSQVQVSKDGTVGSQEYGGSTDRQNVYRVNQKGMINFPVLGMIQASGMTIDELQNSISNAIINGGYLADPKVCLLYTSYSWRTSLIVSPSSSVIGSTSIASTVRQKSRAPSLPALTMRG